MMHRAATGSVIAGMLASILAAQGERIPDRTAVPPRESGDLTAPASIPQLDALPFPLSPQSGGGGGGVYLTAGYTANQDVGDYREWLVMNGVQLISGTTRILAQSGVILLDEQRVMQDWVRPAVRPAQQQADELPRRTTQPPDPRRQLTEEVLRARLDSFLRAAGRGTASLALPGVAGVQLGTFRSLYLEGGVTIVQDGIEVLRCSRMHWSIADDRAAFYDVVLRLPSRSPTGETVTLTVRGERLLRQGPRFIGRDLTLTTCTAGEPHFAVRSGEAQIIESGEQFQVHTVNNHLLIGGNSVVPLPDTTFYTGEQSQIPLRSASLGWSKKEKWQTRLDFGGPMNDVGGAVHELVTGRDPSEFHGDWHLGVGYNHARGWPLRGGIDYRADDLYRGYTHGFFLDDQGRNLREIRNNLDGTPIETDQRGLVQTENRIQLGHGTTLDVTVFHATDPAVWPEFFGSSYLRAELPESSLHLRSAAENRLLTVTGRYDLNAGEFAYDSSRRLTPSFLDELPLATFDWFAEPLAQLPGHTPLLLTSSTSAGYLRRQFDDTTVPRPDGVETLRVDQELELAAPFHLDPLALRPFVSGRFTWWQDSPADRDLQRWAFTTGAQAGTRLSRVFRWRDAAGLDQAVRHDILPTVTFADRFDVLGTGPLQPFQLDSVDASDSLREQMLVRVGVLNDVERLTRSPKGERVDQLVWLDLAQNVLPVRDRDNGGHLVGLFEYELVLRAGELVPVPGLRFHVEGEHDWQRNEERTFDALMRFGPVAGVDWHLEYRADRTREGTIGYGAATRLLGRWGVVGQSQYDLEESRPLNYAVILQRHDHDWVLSLGVSYDVVEGQSSVFANFEPTLGGLIRPRSRYLAGVREYGTSEW